jgi:hypothetical protein
MAQALSRRPLTAEVRIRSRAIPCGICGGQSGSGTGFSPSTSIFSCQFHSNGAPLQGKTKRMGWNVACMDKLRNIYMCINNFNVIIWFEKTVLENKPGWYNSFKIDLK